MDEASDARPEHDRKDATSPPSGNAHQATSPPGNGERDEDAISKGEDKLDQAGGGH